jgi:ABC-type dipeptide/oligopeptide/nickel transport system permease component
MIRPLLSRLIQAVPTLAGVAVIVFVLVRVVPGNPIAMMLPPGASQADFEHLKALYGFDKSIPEQFIIWLRHAVMGDFGTSISMHSGVLGLVLSRLPATLELAALAGAIAIALGGLAAVAGARWQGRWPEAAIDAAIGFSQAIPDFIWALAAILVLGVLIPVLPISGRSDPGISLNYVTQFQLTESILRRDGRAFIDLMRHMILPALALALPLAAIIARVLKTSLKEEMTQDYVLLARVKGFGEWRILVREALRNAAIPTVALTGVQITFLIGGTVLIERIFSYPGIGNLAIDAVINRDLPMIQGLVLVFALLFIVINLALDFATVALNPRLEHG